MEYYINFEDFEEFKNVFERKLDEFNEEVYKVFKSYQDVEWLGKGHDAVITAIDKQIGELTKVSKTMYRFLEFMDMAMNNYSEGVEDVKKHFYEIEDMINSMKR